ncbi:protein-methionine-sulfoxide reductase heme-binding subunit MsrQ [Derxia lacustris]|uniref:sulfite oxidase heme-binding subunit YedZ n=1 Tax=Derxia lacustris TaxID=764842 RepID=UPI000A174813|nr:protein-methionine-sulfoxide reductase heme-binding subunit MsrQ [Derxia lacustris]
MSVHPFPPRPAGAGFALRHLTLIKTAVWLLALLPAARLVIGLFGYALAELPGGALLLAVGRDLGANPLETLTRSTGFSALVLLALTLAVTPLRQWLGQPWLIRLRRPLGLFVFFYAVLHALCWVWFDHFFDPRAMARDVFKRPFITLGFAAFVLLVPLALTSFNAAVRWLGGKRWQWLHRLVYVAAALAVTHFWWMKAGKHDLAQPVVFVLVMLALAAARIVWKRRRPVRPTAPADWIQVRRPGA